jgi:hypothetical protein
MQVGWIMQRTWTAALAEQFPARRFVVELLQFEDDWHISTLHAASMLVARSASEVLRDPLRW